MADIDTLIAEMRVGLEGVTPGPWHYFPHEHSNYTGPGTDAFMSNEEDVQVIDCNWASATEEGDRTYKHIARCSPDNIAALLGEIERLRALVKTLSDPDMYWSELNNDYPDHGSFDDASENPGIVVEYACARHLPPVYVVTLEEDQENDPPLWGDWFHVAETSEAALTALAAERVRRTMLQYPPAEAPDV